MPADPSNLTRQPDKSNTVAHTPGPWTVNNENCTFPGIEADASQQSIVLWGLEDEDCGVRGRTPEEIEANARLIAAAPDLLEALKAIQILSHEEGDAHNEWDTGDLIESLRSIDRLARAAILRAEGGQ